MSVVLSSGSPFYVNGNAVCALCVVWCVGRRGSRLAGGGACADLREPRAPGAQRVRAVHAVHDAVRAGRLGAAHEEFSRAPLRLGE